MPTNNEHPHIIEQKMFVTVES